MNERSFFFSPIAGQRYRQMGYRQILISGLICLFFSPVIGFAGQKSVDADEQGVVALLSSLQEHLTEIETVQADFIQRKDLTMFDRQLVIKGRMAVRTPDRVAWHVVEPVRYAMLIDGKELTQWDEDTDRIQKMRLDRDPAFRLAIEQLTVWFSGRYLGLLDQYSITVEQEDPYVLIFRPLSGTAFEKVIKEVRVKFREDKRYIQRLQIREGGGDTTILQFFDTRLNEPVGEDMWRVRP